MTLYKLGKLPVRHDPRTFKLADYVHALGSLATLAIVGLLTQGMLAFLLRGSGGTALSTAFFLANVVISPLLFIGSALLYVDQAARVPGPGGAP